MPESPDFDQIARHTFDTFLASLKVEDQPTTIVATVAEQLRQVWNARGAADIARVKCENCDEPISEVFITDDDVELCRECWSDVPVERRFTVVGQSAAPSSSPVPEATTRERIIRAVGAADCCGQDEAYFVAVCEGLKLVKEQIDNRRKIEAEELNNFSYISGLDAAESLLDSLLTELAGPQ